MENKGVHRRKNIFSERNEVMLMKIENKDPKKTTRAMEALDVTGINTLWINTNLVVV